MSPNRVVAILTPLVFAPLAGFVTAWVARNAPGLPALDTTQVTALFVAGATIAFGKAALWMRGWHLHMQSADGQVGVEQPDPFTPDATTDPGTGDPEGDYDPNKPFDHQQHVEANGGGVTIPKA
jgi:hypothetical protein